jgi:hypothetical protein
MTKREIKRRIYLTGTKDDYRVMCDMPGAVLFIRVPRARIGHAIVGALRELAEKENGHATQAAR